MTPDQQAGAPAAQVEKQGDRQIHIVREFDAPRERVFEAFTDAEQVVQWWGPHETTTTIDKLEARTGGDWRFVIKETDGSESAFRGTFREVTPPERIAWTFEWSGMPGYISLDQTEFEDLGDGRTRVTTTSTFLFGEERDGMLEAGMESGLNESYERLDELLAKDKG
jgi:uncharacterized protein YndB with AHSA1/START domain